MRRIILRLSSFTLQESGTKRHGRPQTVSPTTTSCLTHTRLTLTFSTVEELNCAAFVAGMVQAVLEGCGMVRTPRRSRTPVFSFAANGLQCDIPPLFFFALLNPHCLILHPLRNSLPKSQHIRWRKRERRCSSSLMPIAFQPTLSK